MAATDTDTEITYFEHAATNDHVRSWQGNKIDIAIATPSDEPMVEQIIVVEVDGESYDIEIRKRD